MGDVEAAAYRLVDLGAERERSRIVAFVCDRAMVGIEHTLDWPLWRRLLWMLLHPVRFARRSAEAQVAIAIKNREYEERGQ